MQKLKSLLLATLFVVVLFPSILQAQTTAEINQTAIKAFELSETSPKEAFKLLQAETTASEFPKAGLAQTILGQFYYSGIGTFPDTKVGMKYWRSAVELGEPNAAFNIAVHYEVKPPFKKDDKAEAFKCAEIAAKDGIPFAMYKYGYCLFYGRYTKKNRDEGIEWIKRAAMEDEPYGCHRLAFLYEYGTHVDRNLGAALDLYTTAAKQDHLPSMLRLYDFYRSGMGTPQDCGKAEAWLDKAVAQNSDEAQFAKGELYLDGACGHAIDSSMARKYISLAADQGNGKARTRLNEMDAPPPPATVVIAPGNGGGSSNQQMTFDQAMEAYMAELDPNGFGVETAGMVDANGRYPIKYVSYEDVQDVVLIVNEGTSPGYYPQLKIEYFNSNGERVGSFTTDVSDVVRINANLTAVRATIALERGVDSATLIPYQSGYFISAFD